MAYPFAHHKLTVFGTQYSATETWSFSVRFQTGDPSSDIPQLKADEDAAAWLNEWNTGLWCNRYAYVGVKWSRIGSDGLVVPGSVPTVSLPAGSGGTPGPEGSGAVVHYPPQCTHVATLLTEATGGRARKGRVYLPPACQAIDTVGHISSTGADILQDGLAAFLSSVTDGETVLAPKVLSNIGAGADNTIVSVQVGRVVDTQRRRRRSLDEARPAPTAITF